MNAPIPTVVAMLVCDQVITEYGTNKKSLIGIFENIYTFTAPAIVPRLSVYVRLLDAEGKYEFTLRLVRLKDEALVAEVKIAAEIGEPLHCAEVGLNMVNLALPELGKYEFQLYTGDVYLHRVTMELTKPPGGTTWPQHQPPR
jgi:hypothetical protein